MPATIHKLPAPPPATREGANSDAAPHVSDTQHIVRERAFSPSTPIEEIIDQMARTRSNGEVVLHFNQGSLASITVHEKQKVRFT